MFKVFKKYNAAFCQKIITCLTRNVQEMNLKGVLLTLVHGNVAHLKTRDNIRAMFIFAVHGVDILARERNSIGSNFD